MLQKHIGNVGVGMMLGGFDALHGKKSLYRYSVGIDDCKFVKIAREELLNVMRTSRTFQLTIQAECKRTNEHFELMKQTAFKSSRQMSA